MVAKKMYDVYNNNMALISLEKCDVADARKTLLKNISWQMDEGQSWLVIGANNSGKAHFLNALAGVQGARFVEAVSASANASASASGSAGSARFASVFGNSVELVSLERAAYIIQEERENDESDYVEGGVDIGRIGRVFIAEPLTGRLRKGAELPEIVRRIESFPAVKLCGVENILERGIKYMSTGEVRRTLLARALVSGKRLLILSNPFAGLDVESRAILLNFFNTIAAKQNASDSASGSAGAKSSAGDGFPHLILAADRYTEIPDAVTHVLEFERGEISFCGKRADYEKLLGERNAENAKTHEAEKKDFSLRIIELANERNITKSFSSVNETHSADKLALANERKTSEELSSTKKNVRDADEMHSAEKSNRDANETEIRENDVLIQMKNVNVGWGENRVLVDLNWSLRRGEHWLIRGPNGSGKTTFLELITGDNMQVFSNDVRLFGKRRGSGETIWDIKRQLGIVSYRLHVEYRMVGSTTLENVIISGFHDSIGLYEVAGDTEKAAARKWLALGGFGGRENESFGSLSYGEQRAILILRAAVKSPPVLILDEPCHGLDENFRRKILDLLEIVAENGNTTLLHVTHEADEVLQCEHHILELLPKQQPMYRIVVR